MSKILACIVACVCVSWISKVCGRDVPGRGKLRNLNQEELFDLLTDESHYNKRIWPLHENTTTPLAVNLSLYLFGLSTVDDLRSEYQLTTLLRLRWFDERLNFDQSFLRDGSSRYIVGSLYHAQRMWIPSIHVVNERGPGSLSSFLNSGSVLIHIEPVGRVLMSLRVSLRLSCSMKFHNYPLDNQTCVIQFESSVLSESNLLLRWADDEPIFRDSFEMPGFYTNYSLTSETAAYKRTGNFSTLLITFYLVRQFGHFVLDVYLPTMLFVFTSWTSFYVEIPAAPARVTIGITSMLTLVTSFKAIREKLPRYPYISAIDIWNFTCTAFVFASLLEYALVNFIYNKEKRKKSTLRRDSSVLDLYSLQSNRNSFASLYALPQSHNTNNNNNNDNRGKECKFTLGEDHMSPLPTISKGSKLFIPHNHFSPCSRRASQASLATCNSDASTIGDLQNCGLGWLLKKSPQDIANGIDRKCRIVFPCLFLLFNIVYWSIIFTNSKYS